MIANLATFTLAGQRATSCFEVAKLVKSHADEQGDLASKLSPRQCDRRRDARYRFAISGYPENVRIRYCKLFFNRRAEIGSRLGRS